MAKDEPSNGVTLVGSPASAAHSPLLVPWDGFVGGPENALAQASVLALAQGGPAALGISPLIVYGPAGVGKSRLLAALVAECLLRHPGSAVAHLEAEAFAAACAEAASRRGGWSELRERFRRLDLFVLEDLHALERAPLARNELVHTLDALDEAGSAVAVSARSGPGQWPGSFWPRRLLNRLAGGLAVRIDPPGLASRRRFVLVRAQAQRLVLAADAVEALAIAGDGYRTLEGWVARLGLAGRLGCYRRPLGRSAVEELLEEEEKEASSGGVTIEQVARAIAERFRVRLGDLRGATRRQTIVAPRHLAIYLARSLTGQSYQSIGAYFGRRDPATVRHACRAAAARLMADPALAAAAAAIRRRWQASEAGESIHTQAW
jgi:chromosomal replication initiator protein